MCNLCPRTMCNLSRRIIPLKERTTVTNGWLSETLRMGNKFEVSRKVSAWARSPDRNLAKKVGLTPNPTV